MGLNLLFVCALDKFRGMGEKERGRAMVCHSEEKCRIGGLVMVDGRRAACASYERDSRGTELRANERPSEGPLSPPLVHLRCRVALAKSGPFP